LAQASGYQLLAQLEERAGRKALADKQMSHALRLLRTAGPGDRLAEAHAAYAEMLEARGDSQGASRHWKQAAKLALRRQTVAARAV